MAKYKFDGVSFRDFSDLMAFLQAYVDVRGNKDSVDSKAVIKRLLEEQREGDAVFGDLTNSETLQRIELIAISVYGGIKNLGEWRAKKAQILAGMSKRMGTLVEGFREHQKKQGTAESRRNLILTKNWEFEDEVQDVEEDDDEIIPLPPKSKKDPEKLPVKEDPKLLPASTEEEDDDEVGYYTIVFGEPEPDNVIPLGPRKKYPELGPATKVAEVVEDEDSSDDIIVGDYTVIDEEEQKGAMLSKDPRSVADGKAKRARTSALKAYEKAAEAFSALTQQAEDFEEKLKEFN